MNLPPPYPSIPSCVLPLGFLHPKGLFGPSNPDGVRILILLLNNVLLFSFLLIHAMRCFLLSSLFCYLS